MPAPQSDNPDCPPSERVPLWVSLELVVDDGEKVTHYAIEGTPAPGTTAEQFKADPVYDDSTPIPHIVDLLMSMNFRLENVTMMATNDPPAGSVKRRRAAGRLRAVD